VVWKKKAVVNSRAHHDYDESMASSVRDIVLAGLEK